MDFRQNRRDWTSRRAFEKGAQPIVLPDDYYNLKESFAADALQV
jgi:hypothetical protein